jgi:hypothetical protein
MSSTTKDDEVSFTSLEKREIILAEKERLLEERKAELEK